MAPTWAGPGLLNVFIPSSFPAKQELKKVDVDEATSSKARSKKNSVKGAIDGDEDTFFHAKHKKRGWAKFKVPKGNVKVVRLQNRKDCCCKCMLLKRVFIKR